MHNRALRRTLDSDLCGRGNTGRKPGTDGASAELALSERAGQTERAGALRPLGYEPDAPLHVLAVTGAPERIAVLLAALRERSGGSPAGTSARAGRSVTALW